MRLTVQRHMGLGQMNPGQFPETKPDPGVRTLLRVRFRYDSEADGVFTTLMGDIVEPRREFIRRNAPSVENLDF